jgi:CBS domain-containing protein
MFSALGLRHLVVTDVLNQVLGIITRKDLLGYAVESRVAKVIRSRRNDYSLDRSFLGIGVDIEDNVHVGLQSTVVVEEDENNDNPVVPCEANDAVAV